VDIGLDPHGELSPVAVSFLESGRMDRLVFPPGHGVNLRAG
jgi:hypothetical protein